MSISAKTLLAGAVLVLAGCGMDNPSPPPAPQVAFNPPPAAVATMTSTEVAWSHVTFANNSASIGAEGMSVIDAAAASMKANPGLKATVVGKADTVGSDAQNMRLSRQRASAVRNALVRTGGIAPNRVETHWTGERPRSAAAVQGGQEANGRVVDIGLH